MKSRKIAIKMIPVLLGLLLCTFLPACNSAGNESALVINSENFPDPLLMEKAVSADPDGSGTLSQGEISAVTRLHIKKLLDERGDHEDGPYPTYTESDFFIDLEGIQHFTALTELTINMLGGEAFVPEGPHEIYAKTNNFDKVYQCKALQKLSLYEVDITELKLAAFPNMKRLDLNCMYALTDLDTMTGKNITFLWISECHKLCELDLCGMEKLKTLNIVDSKNISNVLFGDANKKLETIQLSGLNSLKTVDFSRLSGLTSLNIKDCALSELDVSRNPKLDQICGEGLKMETLDLTNNPAVSYIINDGDSFQRILLPDDNRVSMIRWTNSATTEFPVHNLNPATLTGIDIQGSNIRILDVSGYPNLEHLYYNEGITKIIK